MVMLYVKDAWFIKINEREGARDRKMTQQQIQGHPGAYLSQTFTFYLKVF